MTEKIVHAVQGEVRRAYCRLTVKQLLKDSANITAMRWDATEAMPDRDKLEEKLVLLLADSPSVPYDLDTFVLVGLLGQTLKWRADKIKFRLIKGGYDAIFLRRSPKWLAWIFPHYVCGAMKRYVFIRRRTVDLPN